MIKNKILSKINPITFTIFIVLALLFSVGTTEAINVGDVFEFDNCGATGRYGPSSCSYSTHSVNIIGDGIQEWEVPINGTYRITAYGAWGGIPNEVTDNSHRGEGAKMSGDFILNSGTSIKIVVGQEGIQNPDGNSANGGGGGGGGSFVWEDGQNNPLIAAGGGGGGSITNTNYDLSLTKGRGGTTGVDGLTSWAVDLLNHGTNGGSATYTSGARGWDYMIVNNFNGMAGTSHGRVPGFGGGGNPEDGNHAGGGGGGYSGGGGGYYSQDNGGNADGRDGGGGGGSYNSGDNQDNQAGVNSGHGKVEIELIELIIETKADNFTNNESTNFSEVNISNVSDPVIADNSDKAKVEWKGNFDLSGADLDSNIKMKDNFIEVNSAQLQQLNTTANVTFKTVSYPGTSAYQVLKNGEVCSDCKKHSSNPVRFGVNGFSNYTTESTEQIPEFNTFVMISLLVIIGLIFYRRK